MNYTLECEVCRHRILVRESDEGKRVRCPQCGMIVAVAPRSSYPVSGSYSEEAGTAPYPQGSSSNANDRYAIDPESERWSLRTSDGEVYGPVSRDELDEWESEGRISASCLVQREGQYHWQSALVLYPHLSAASSAGSWPGASGPATSRPRNPVPPLQPVRSGKGVLVLILAIIGWFTLPMIVFGALAWFIGASERRALQRGEIFPASAGLIHIGYFLGMVATIVGVASWFGCCFLFQ